MLKVQNLSRLMIGPVSFDLADGQCAAITGPSGCGKSLLLRAIVDLDPNAADLVQANGMVRDETEATDWRRQVALLPADSGWWLDRVAGHFANADKMAAMLGLVDLPAEAMNWQVARLSTGEKHRLALLRCLENEPRVLLLDEVTAPLDEQTTLLVETLLKQQMAKGVSILMVTHDKVQAKRFPNRILQLQDGQLSEVAA